MSDGLERDPELARALREAGGDVPFDEVHWDALHARIVDGARLALARRRAATRRAPTWIELAASWARPAIPLALAASIALMVVLGRIGEPTATTETASLDPESALAGAVSANRSGDDVVRVIYGASREAWMLDEVFSVE